jgi:hypothetical protein
VLNAPQVLTALLASSIQSSAQAEPSKPNLDRNTKMIASPAQKDIFVIWEPQLLNHAQLGFFWKQ